VFVTMVRDAWTNYEGVLSQFLKNIASIFRRLRYYYRFPQPRVDL